MQKTERVSTRGAEAALKEQELRYQLVAEAANDAIWDWDLTKDEIIWNEGLTVRFGYTPEMVSPRAEWWMERIHPQDKERVTSAIKRCLEIGPDKWRDEYLFLAVDGKYRRVLDRGRIVRDENGKPVRMVGSMVDLTEKRRAEEELEVARERLDFVLSSSGIGFWYLDWASDVLKWDAQTKAHFHLPPDAHITLELFYSILHPDDREPTKEAVSKAIDAGLPYDVSYRTVNPKDGSFKWIRAIGRTYGKDKDALRFDGLTIDITEQKRAEEALKEVDRRKTEFLATLAHELRNPLAPIKTGIELLRRSYDGMRSTIDMMERQLGNMVRLIDDLLDVSRISSGKIVLQKERVDIKSAIRDALDASYPLIEAQGHTLKVALSKEAIYVEGDKTRLSQIIGNLLNNAAKYTPQGGVIEVSLTSDRSRAIISIADTGIGIPEEHQEEIFDMFAQVDKALERSKEGLGIGLALVKRLVELHRGNIAVKSATGEGSTFTVEFPLDVSTAETIVTQSVEASLTLPRRVLIVDDNIDGAQALEMFVSILGHEVRTSHNGLDAITLAKEFLPEVVFLDLGLPGLNGYEVARELRKEPSLNATYLVALTGWGSSEDKRKSKEAGFDQHLTKPVDTEEVERLLSEFQLP